MLNPVLLLTLLSSATNSLPVNVTSLRELYKQNATSNDSLNSTDTLVSDHPKSVPEPTKTTYVEVIHWIPANTTLPLGDTPLPTDSVKVRPPPSGNETRYSSRSESHHEPITTLPVVVDGPHSSQSTNVDGQNATTTTNNATSTTYRSEKHETGSVNYTHAEIPHVTFITTRTLTYTVSPGEQPHTEKSTYSASSRRKESTMTYTTTPSSTQTPAPIRGPLPPVYKNCTQALTSWSLAQNTTCSTVTAQLLSLPRDSYTGLPVLTNDTTKALASVCASPDLTLCFAAADRAYSCLNDTAKAILKLDRGMTRVLCHAAGVKANVTALGTGGSGGGNPVYGGDSCTSNSTMACAAQFTQLLPQLLNSSLANLMVTSGGDGNSSAPSLAVTSDWCSNKCIQKSLVCYTTEAASPYANLLKSLNSIVCGHGTC